LTKIARNKFHIFLIPPSTQNVSRNTVSPLIRAGNYSQTVSNSLIQFSPNKKWDQGLICDLTAFTCLWKFGSNAIFFLVIVTLRLTADSLLVCGAANDSVVHLDVCKNIAIKPLSHQTDCV
jgi:hypothetical protein